MKRVVVPNRYAFKDYDIYDFDKAISIFDWDYENEKVIIDFTDCAHANYQAISLIVLYVWYLKSRNCYVDFLYDKDNKGASDIWSKMGARGWSQVLGKEGQNFIGHSLKPLIALRGNEDFKKAISKVESYTEGFDVEYEKTLRYVLSELLYNTLEHGKIFIGEGGHRKRVPSVIQFTWYKKSDELHFIIADTGIGIKQHLEQAYPGIEDDKAAIHKALGYKVSGTFGINDPYKNKNNAGVGLYLSSNIVRKLHAEMHIVSGHGLVHISPRDTTSKTLKNKWNGTFVLVTVKLGGDSALNLHKLMSEIRDGAENEVNKGAESESKGEYYLSIKNFFGSFAENKDEAISHRDRYLMKAVAEEKILRIDFQDVVSAPHSFLSALLASPIRVLGMKAYRAIKIVNAEPEIRETIDYILDDNTA